MDKQAEAFTGATSDDLWDDNLNALVRAEGAVVHPPADPDQNQITLPEQYEQRKWDAGRDGPKTLADARAALAARIADPAAPDDGSHADAYREEDQ